MPLGQRPFPRPSRTFSLFHTLRLPLSRPSLRVRTSMFADVMAIPPRQ